jgi:hypothetical protein
LDWLNNAANLSAGVGDTITFGLTALIRKRGGFDVVNRCSGWYWSGQVVGEIWWTAAGGAYGLEKSGLSFWEEMANLTVTDSRWSELGLDATMSAAEKLERLGGPSGVLAQQLRNMFSPSAWGRLYTNLPSGPTLAGQYGRIGAWFGLGSVAWNQFIGYFWH